MKTLFKIGNIFSIILVLIFQSCKKDCTTNMKDIGTVSLTTYNKGIIFNTYSPNQTIKFLRNNTDTIILHTSSSYLSYNAVTYPTDPNTNDCGTWYQCELENLGIYLNSSLKDTTFYFKIQSYYSKNSSDFERIRTSDTLYQLIFAITKTGNTTGTFAQTRLYIENIYKDSLLLNNIQINGRTFNKVYYRKDQSGWHFKEIYFHPLYGIIKFSFYKGYSISIPGDVYEIIL